jgi:hypothetical protein
LPHDGEHSINFHEFVNSRSGRGIIAKILAYRPLRTRIFSAMELKAPRPAPLDDEPEEKRRPIWEEREMDRIAVHLSLYVLPLILPYDSYLGTLATRVWIGNPTGKSKNFQGDHNDPAGESLSRGVRFPTQTQDQRCGIRQG